jgi:hypothetical protein
MHRGAVRVVAFGLGIIAAIPWGKAGAETKAPIATLETAHRFGVSRSSGSVETSRCPDERSSDDTDLELRAIALMSAANPALL